MISCDCNLIEALNTIASSNDPLGIDSYDDGYTIELNDDNRPNMSSPAMNLVMVQVKE